MWSRVKVQEEVLLRRRGTPVQVLIAPTGFGKSYLFRLAVEARERVIHVLPLRSVIGSTIEKVVKVAGGTVAYQASMDVLRVKVDGEEVIIRKDPYMLSPYIVTTYDSTVFSLLIAPVADMMKARAHWDVALASITNRLLILDEAHMLGHADDVIGYSPFANVSTLALYLTKNVGCSVVFASATLPAALARFLSSRARSECGLRTAITVVGGRVVLEYYRKGLLEHVGGDAVEVTEVNVDDISDEDFRFVREVYRDSVRTSPCRVDTRDLAEYCVREGIGSRILIIVNTVRRAAEIYERLKHLTISDHELLLLHGRVGVKERERRVRELSERLRDGGVVVVATQVIEAGLDAHFDTIISDIAPLESLIQRFGRTLRVRDDAVAVGRGDGPVRLVISLSESAVDGSVRVYGHELTRLTCVGLTSVVGQLASGVEDAERFVRGREHVDWRYGDGRTVYRLLEYLDPLYDRVLGSGLISLGHIEGMFKNQVMSMVLGGQHVIEGSMKELGGFIRRGGLIPLLVFNGDRVEDVVEVSSDFVVSRRDIIIDEGGRAYSCFTICLEDDVTTCSDVCEVCSGSDLVRGLAESPLPMIYRMIRKLTKGLIRGGGTSVEYRTVFFKGIKLLRGYDDELGLI